MTTLKLEPVVLKAAALGDVNPMPDLKNVSYIHAGFETTSRVTQEDRAYFGKGAISTLLPYLSQDGYDRQRKDTVFQAAVLENEWMKAVFLPQLGGRLWSLYHKKLGRELLYVNDIVQPCNLGLRNAWVAGGVEWNVSIKGHTPFTCETIFAAHSENSKGEPVLSMYEYERIRGVVFGINAYLQEDRLYIRTTVENCSGAPTYTYWWSNIAVPEKGIRVLTEAEEMFSCVYEDNHYTIDRIPAPYYGGRDLSYPENAPHAGDMFYILPDHRRKWIAALDADGTGLLQYSTPELKGRKMFFWGDGEGGRNWNRFLTGREDAYIEIQAGLLRTQMEHVPMPEGAVWGWTECYTAASMEPEMLRGDWHAASRALARQVAAMPDPAGADIPLTARKDICVMGSGWGALEGRPISAFYDFPAESMDKLQDEWRMLKREGYLPEPDGEEPPQSYQITKEMLSLLERSVKMPRGDHWYTWLHIGVVRYALGDLSGAKQAWEASCAMKQTPWVLRNLAVLHKNEFDEGETAVRYICKAVALCTKACRGLLTDAAKILTECGWSAAWLEIFGDLPEDLKQNGRLLLYTAIAHMDQGDFAAAKAILNEDFAMTDIKEGELSLTAVWAQLYGEEKKLPRHLNFRMHEKYGGHAMKHRFPDRSAFWMPSEELFLNPHKGFTTFQRFRGDRVNENWTVETGWKMEELPEWGSLATDEHQLYPDSTIAYFRIPWRIIEPEQGCYDFLYLDKVLEAADARGQKVMLRFPPHSARSGPLELPDWFCRALNVPERKNRNKQTPIHPLYFETYGNMIRAVGAHIDGDPRLTALDMSLISAWGEGDQMDMVPEPMWKQLVDAYMQGFQKTPVSAQFNHPDSVFYANTYRPVGIRGDCLGNMNDHMLNHYPRFFPLMGKLWEKAPIAFEVCWVLQHWQDMGWDVDYIIEQSLKWHITSFNAKSAPVPPEWMDKMENWIKKMGYRYAVRRVDYPTEGSAGDVMHLGFWIENRGVAPIYHRYPFVLRLRGEHGTFDLPTDADITTWLPGDTLYDCALQLPLDIPKGKYLLEAGIRLGSEQVRLATDSPCNDGFNQIGGTVTIL